MKVKRSLVQVISAIATNGYIKGFINKTMYKGKVKRFCVPGLNCYSCPGAMGACPIGSIQAVLGSMKYNFSFYVVGIISLFGVIFGRFICGWICPFGFIQELIHKIPIHKVKVNKKLHNVLKYVKYIILIIFVILLPIFLVDEIGMSEPYFCKFICPAGTLEGGIPQVLLNEGLRDSIGFLFNWKLSILIAIGLLSIIIYRPFCKYLCPLGAIYGILNHISFCRIKVDKEKCTSCGACAKVCKMNVEIYKHPNDSECIKCGKCIKVCPNKAIKNVFIDSKKI